MKRAVILILLALGLPAHAQAALSGVDDMSPNIPPETQEKLDNAVMTYYQAPSIEKVDTVLDIMNDSNVLRKKTSWAPLVGFLSIIFADNKDHVMDWMSRKDYNSYAEDVFIAALLHAHLHESAMIFAQAHQWKKPGLDRLRAYQEKVDLKHLNVVIPGHIDTLWGAFFASGDPVYVNEIIDVLFATSAPHSSEVSGPPGYDMLAENKKLAQSTLVEYAAQQKAVRSILQRRIAREKDAGKRKTLQQLLPAQSFPDKG